MKNLNLVLKDHIFDLVEEASILRGKPISNTLEDLISEYFSLQNKKPIEEVVPKFDYTSEVWKDIPDYEGYYQVSNMGRIASTRFGFKIMSCVRNTSGYQHVSFVVKKVRHTALVHTIVAKAFLTKEDGKTQVDHINGIKSDNRVDNLQWVSRSENMKNNYLRDTNSSEKLRARGRKVELFDNSGKSIGIFNKVKDAADFLNVSTGNISSICNPNNTRLKSLTKNKISGKYL
jgi:hypothetical protein